jgi:hypothetical protein
LWCLLHPYIPKPDCKLLANGMGPMKEKGQKLNLWIWRLPHMANKIVKYYLKALRPIQPPLLFNKQDPKRKESAM